MHPRLLDLSRFNLVAVGPSFAAPPDPNFYYKLSTLFRGPGLVLDVINGGPQNDMTRLEPSREVTGQFWRMRLQLHVTAFLGKGPKLTGEVSAWCEMSLSA